MAVQVGIRAVIVLAAVAVQRSTLCSLYSFERLVCIVQPCRTPLPRLLSSSAVPPRVRSCSRTAAR